ncbi:MAG: sorbosone dehydrogenase family protein, partial [Alphaproteobacteria bacterium]
MTKRIPVTAAAVLLCVAPLAPAVAQDGDQKVGARFEVRLEDLPKLGATPSSVNPPEKVKRGPDDGLRVPEGFQASIFAQGLDHPRWMGLA